MLIIEETGFGGMRELSVLALHIFCISKTILKKLRLFLNASDRINSILNTED